MSRMASAIDFTRDNRRNDLRLRERPKSALNKKTSTFENLFGSVEVKRQKPIEATLFRRLQPESPSLRARPSSVCPVTGRVVGAKNIETRHRDCVTPRGQEPELGRFLSSSLPRSGLCWSASQSALVAESTPPTSDCVKIV